MFMNIYFIKCSPEQSGTNGRGYAWNMLQMSLSKFVYYSASAASTMLKYMTRANRYYDLYVVCCYWFGGRSGRLGFVLIFPLINATNGSTRLSFSISLFYSELTSDVDVPNIKCATCDRSFARVVPASHRMTSFQSSTTACLYIYIHWATGGRI